MKADALQSASLKLEADIRNIMSQMHPTDDPDGQSSMKRLLDDWVCILGMLELTPGRPERNCPNCGQLGFAAATRCGYCWTVLTPEPAAPTSRAPEQKLSPQQHEARNSFENEGGPVSSRRPLP